GVYANNPGIHAYRIATNYLETVGEDRREDKIFLVSLGTGKSKRPYRWEELAARGKARWAEIVIDVTFFSICDTVDRALERLLDEKSFFRLQIDLGADRPAAMDDVKEANLLFLESRAEQLIAEHEKRIGQICAEISRV